jgi:putative ABC transport system ATP-binding protein
VSAAQSRAPSGAVAEESGLRLRAVAKSYRSGKGEIQAVDGVSLEIGAGEFVALYGPSGSGKTTLMMMIAALLQPDSGSILFGGREISKLSESEASQYRSRDVGFIAQDFHLIPNASALDNALIKLPLHGLTTKEAKAKTLPWLERLGLADRAEHPPEQLSMGEQQRVAIARALVGEPGLLLADEPTGNLNSKLSREILELLGDLCRKRKMPGLLVTHDPDAARFVDRVLKLRDGRLVDPAEAEDGGPAGDGGPSDTP